MSLNLAIGVLTALTAARAPAQEPAKPATLADKSLEEVIVTGSRIARPDLERLEPTTVVNAEQLERRGFTNLIQALNENPAFGPPDNSPVGNQSNFGVAQSFANLYGLGSQRTLTLVNGRRFVSSNTPSIFGPTGNGGEQVDLNVIPTKLIDRVETIGIGGAPIYGSDAIAGTVNVILKHDYEGTEVEATGGLSGRHDASEYRLSAISGKNFADGRGNLTASVEFNKSHGLTNAERPLLARDLAFHPPAAPGPFQNVLIQNERLGSISFGGVPLVDDNFLAFAPNQGIYGANGQLLAFNGTGSSALTPYTLGPSDGTGIWNVGGDGLDFSKLSNLTSPQERINANLLGHFQLNDRARLFGEAWLSETHSRNLVNQGAYSTSLFAGAGQVSGNLIIPLSNPYLSAADRAIIAQNLAAYAAASPQNPQQTDHFYLTRLNQDLQDGSGTGDQIVTRFVVGVDGKIPLGAREWQYEVSANYGESKAHSIEPALNVQNFNNALNAVLGPNGQIVCGGNPVASPVGAQSNTCAPLDVLGYHTASRAALDYVTSLVRTDSKLTQRVFSASLNGALFTLPAGDLKAALGYENRRESSAFVPDQFYQTGAGVSIPIGPISGAFRTNEVFGELLVPLVAPAQDIPALHRLELEGAARSVSHSVAGRDTTWTTGLRWEPLSTLQFRGNLTRAIRAPSVTEAFNPNSQAFATANDPCDARFINGGPNPANRAKNCAAAGIAQPFTSNIVDFTEQISVSGNPNLKNEQANSRTYGAVFRPSDRIDLSVDYIKIDIKQAIVQLDAVTTLDACYDGSSYPNAFCSQITRDGKGQVTFIKTGYANAGQENFDGIQSAFHWSFDIPSGADSGRYGGLDVALNHFFTNKLTTRVATGDLQITQGEIGNSRQRGTIDLTWHKSAVFWQWQTRYIGKAVWNPNVGPTTYDQNVIHAWWLHDTTVGYQASEHLKLSLVINNVLNKEPPYPETANPGPASGTSTYFSGLLGRYFIGSVAYRF